MRVNGCWLLKLCLSEVFGHAFEFGFDVAFGGAVDGFVEAGVFAEELPLGDGDLDFGSGLHQGHVFVFGQPGFLEHGPEVLFHLRCDLGDDGAAFVVDGGIGGGGGEGEAVARHPGVDGAPQGTGVVEVGGHAVFAGFPLLAEESASREVFVEVVGKVHAEVGEDVLEEVVGHNGFAIIRAQK